jgi:hypothetical protein
MDERFGAERGLVIGMSELAGEASIRRPANIRCPAYISDPAYIRRPAIAIVGAPAEAIV